jgi:hypothetical protein
MASTPDLCGTDESRSGEIATLLGGLATLLYGVSFFYPAIKDVLGFQAFVYAVISIVFIPMWFANPVFWLGTVFLFQHQWRAACRYGLVALALGLSEAWIVWRELTVGYFFWVGSMALLAVAGWFGWLTSR